MAPHVPSSQICTTWLRLIHVSMYNMAAGPPNTFLCQDTQHCCTILPLNTIYYTWKMIKESTHRPRIFSDSQPINRTCSPHARSLPQHSHTTAQPDRPQLRNTDQSSTRLTDNSWATQTDRPQIGETDRPQLSETDHRQTRAWWDGQTTAQQDRQTTVWWYRQTDHSLMRQRLEMESSAETKIPCPNAEDCVGCTPDSSVTLAPRD